MPISVHSMAILPRPINASSEFPNIHCVNDIKQQLDEDEQNIGIRQWRAAKLFGQRQIIDLLTCDRSEIFCSTSFNDCVLSKITVLTGYC